MSPDAIGSQRSSEVTELKSVLGHVATIVEVKSLLPAAEAAFLEQQSVEPSTLGGVRSLSQQLLHAYLSEAPDPSTLPDPKRSPSHAIALRYAAALVRQEDVLDALLRVDPSNAPLQDALTGTDRKRIDDFLLYRNVKGRFETLDSLVDLWERSVVWVEQKGESYVYDEFADRLIGRDSLEDAISLISPGPRRAVASCVHPLDQRFDDATRPLSEPIRRRTPWHHERWWWFRVPNRIGSSFQRRLADLAPGTAEE